MRQFTNKLNAFLNPAYKLAVIAAVILSTGYISYKHWKGDAFTVGGTQTITGVKLSLGENSDFNLVTQRGIKTAIDALVLSSGTNPWLVVNTADYGAVNNVVVPACCASQNVTGTDSRAAVQAAINNAADNQIVLTPFSVLIASPLDTLNKKRYHLIFLRDIYTNGASCFISGFPNPGGTDKQSLVEVYGGLYGKINLPAHTAATYAAHTGPNWAGLTGAGVTMFNCNKEKYRINRVEGFRYGVVFKAGGGTGGQENGFAGTWIQQCGTDVLFQSTDGNSFMDKAEIGGWDGGSLRLSGGLGIEYDGYAPAAAVNGETNNGAFRSNRIHAMMENVDSAIIANGDITENEFDITFELGPNGVHGTTYFKMLSTGPNLVRSPKYTGRGAMCTNWLTQGVGVNGRIDMPIYYNCSSYIGSNARIDGSGNVIVEVSPTLSQATRALLPANIKTVNAREPDNDPNTTGSSITLATGQHRITMNNAAGTVAFTSAANRPGDAVWVVNKHATNALSITGVSNISSLPAGMSVPIVSDGSVWFANFYYISGGGGGGGFWNLDGSVNINFLNRVAIGRTGPQGLLHVGPSTTSIPGFILDPGPLPMPVKNGEIVNDSFNLFFTAQSVRKQIVTVDASNQIPGQTIQVNSAGTGTNFVWPSSSLIFTSHAEVDVSASSSAGATSMLGGALPIGHAINNSTTVTISGSGTMFTNVSTTTAPGIDFVLGSVRTAFGGGLGTAAANSTYEYDYTVRITPTGTANQTLFDAKITVYGLGTSTLHGQSGATFNTTTPSVNILGYFNNSGNQYRNYVVTARVETVNP